ncbi:MAG TPA: hypothetical protein VFK13_07830 [Gemmatimonadaceae bacterium]|nr:hypothetical protein [Gemmatimonadaceae bacterium]
MDLPKLRARPTSTDLSIAFAHAARTLLVEGRKALSVAVFGAGGRMVTTADLLAKCSEALAQDRRPTPLFRDTWYSLLLLKGFLTWEAQTLRSYCEALFPVEDSSRAAHNQCGHPFVVRELIEASDLSRASWAVGCDTWESAEQAFENRVACNIADYETPGAVVALDCRRDLLICWTHEVTP